MLPPRRQSPVNARSLPSLRHRYRMGGLPVGVSPVCLGLVGDPRVVPAAFDAGVNFFFVTADMHWPLYEKLRRGLELLFERGGGVRDEVVVGVVSYVTQPEFCHAPFHEVVAAIKGLERVDLAIAGGAYAADLLVRLGEYRAHQPEREPASRAIGASFHDRRAGVLALNHGLIDIGFLRYNPLHRGAEEEVFPQLSKGSPALLYNFKSTHGYLSEPDSAALGLGPSHWRPHITDYYRYALSRPEMDGILCALNEPEQVTELIDALERGALNEDQTQYLNDLAELALGRASLATPPD